jgi:hypothetical protein
MGQRRRNSVSISKTSRDEIQIIDEFLKFYPTKVLIIFIWVFYRRMCYVCLIGARTLNASESR